MPKNRTQDNPTPNTTTGAPVARAERLPTFNTEGVKPQRFHLIGEVVSLFTHWKKGEGSHPCAGPGCQRCKDNSWKPRRPRAFVPAIGRHRQLRKRIVGLLPLTEHGLAEFGPLNVPCTGRIIETWREAKGACEGGILHVKEVGREAPPFVMDGRRDVELLYDPYSPGPAPAAIPGPLPPEPGREEKPAPQGHPAAEASATSEDVAKRNQMLSAYARGFKTPPAEASAPRPAPAEPEPYNPSAAHEACEDVRAKCSGLNPAQVANGGDGPSEAPAHPAAGAEVDVAIPPATEASAPPRTPAPAAEELAFGKYPDKYTAHRVQAAARDTASGAESAEWMRMRKRLKAAAGEPTTPPPPAKPPPEPEPPPCPPAPPPPTTEPPDGLPIPFDERRRKKKRRRR